MEPSTTTERFFKLYEGSLVERIGCTPIVKLNEMFPQELSVFGKLEEHNLAGSIKARTALALLQDAHKKGILHPHSIIVESSSGNLGLALAMICNCLGLQFICVVDSRTNQETIKLLRIHNAEVIVIEHPEPDAPTLLEARIKRVKKILAEVPHSIWLNQYENLANPRAHHETIKEFLLQLHDKPDYFICAISTCGTLKGCSEILRKFSPTTKIVAVDAAGSCIFSESSERRLLPGFGAGFRPPLFNTLLADIHIRVPDLDAIAACHCALKKQGILVGASSGAALAGLLAISKSIPKSSTCALILPDGGERYSNTVYSRSWISEQFGSASYSEIRNETYHYTAEFVPVHDSPKQFCVNEN